MAVKARAVTIGTDRFKIRQGQGNFVRTSAAVMSPPTDIPGQPGAQNLVRHLYPWTLTEFSGGEGRLVFDQSAASEPPTYKQTDGGIDTRTRGQFSMQPVPTVVSVVTDPRAIHHGQGDEIWAAHYDGTNTDIYKWDFTNSDWDSVHLNARASAPMAMCASDVNEYCLYQDETIQRFDTAGIAQHTGAGLANTTAAGIAVANNRLYYLAFGSARKLWEITLDGGGAAIAENTNEYKRVATEADFPDEVNPNVNIRQRMCSTGNGVRFFIDLRGGPTTIYEFSEGALKPLPVGLPEGYRASAIYHYAGTTYIGVHFNTRGSSPSLMRSGIYYIGADLIPRFLGYLRRHDPDDEPIYGITAWENDLYFLQGLNVWRYDGTNGGIVLDRTVGASDETKARGLAVMDRQQWVAYEGQGVFVATSTYPTNTTVYLYSPVWDYDVPDANKTLLRVDVVTQPLPANTSISIDYQDNEDGVWTTITAPASASTTGSTTHIFPVWGTATSPTTVNFRNLQWRVGLRSSNGTSTPTIRSVTARAMIIDYQEMVELVLDISNDTSANHLAGEQRSGRQKANNLMAYKTAKALVAFEDHYSSERPGDKDSYAAVLTDLTLDLDDKGEGVARVKLVTIN